MSRLIEILKKHIPSSISKDQSKDSALALLLILLIIGYFTGNKSYFGLGIILLLPIMTWPYIFKPIGYLWLTFSSLLGSLSSKIILSVVFFLIVMPIGFIRKLSGIDNLKLLQFKKGRSSVLLERDHTFNRSDLEKPY